MECCSSELNADLFVSERVLSTILLMQLPVSVAQRISSVLTTLSVTLITLKTDGEGIRRSPYALHLVSDEEP